jgi:hypothetical protein
METLGYTPPEESSEVKSEKAKELHTPYYEVTLAAFSKEFPEQKAGLETVLDEIDNQGIENFASFKSKDITGVSFSYTKLSITPELISRLAKNSASIENLSVENNSKGKAIVADEESQTEENSVSAKNQDYFIFSGSAFPPDGHAFTPEDVEF